MPGTASRCAVLALAGLLAGSVVAADAAAASDALITGAWASTQGPERLVFMPGGYFRTCYASNRQGNAAMGHWKRLSAGLYAVEFTHTATPDCNGPLQPIRKHPASIRGQVRISKGELALYVSGEFPPDLYRPLAISTPK